MRGASQGCACSHVRYPSRAQNIFLTISLQRSLGLKHIYFPLGCRLMLLLFHEIWKKMLPNMKNRHTLESKFQILRDLFDAPKHYQREDQTKASV